MMLSVSILCIRYWILMMLRCVYPLYQPLAPDDAEAFPLLLARGQTCYCKHPPARFSSSYKWSFIFKFEKTHPNFSLIAYFLQMREDCGARRQGTQSQRRQDLSVAAWRCFSILVRWHFQSWDRAAKSR